MVTLTERQQNILRLVIKEYIETAEPVGSQTLTGNKTLDVSAATVRNELHDLEEAGFLTHPHTSAGRIPTELGYRYFVDSLTQPENIDKQNQDEILFCVKNCADAEQGQKQIAQYVAGMLQEAVIIVRGRERLYYTGISHLFSQKEFQDHAFTLSISQIFDHFEKQVDAVYDKVLGVEPRVLIGSDNPLGSATSIVGTRMSDEDLFIVFGPMRMDYVKTIGTLKFLTSVI
jgi:heat-inducible transcriptional repressor